MRVQLLILLILTAAGFRAPAQAPETVDRRDIDGEYRRPNIRAPMFDALAVTLTPESVAAVVADLNLITRNLADSSVVNHRIRSRALGIALRLNPDDRAAIIANGQLARNTTPAPLPSAAVVTPEGIARRLFSAAQPLIDSPAHADRSLALHLFDLARSLDPRLQPQIFMVTYGTTPDWPEMPAASEFDAAPALALQKAGTDVLLPAMAKGQLGILTVSAAARPAPGGGGLKVALPASLTSAMKEKGGEALRTEIETRMKALREALRLRHEIWPEEWVVEIAITGQGVPHLPSLFAGMAVALEALLSGETPDPRCLVAVGLDAENRPRELIPVEQLLPAAALQQTSRLLLLPADAGPRIDDWLLTNPAQWPLLFHITLHRAADFTDVLALTKSERAPLLEQAVSRFAEIAAALKAAADPLATLRRPETIAKLREVVTWHPQHLSASALLTVAAGGPPFLTPSGSLKHLDQLNRCLLSTDRKAHPLHKPRTPFQKTEFGLAGEAITAARNLLHPSIRPYAAEIVTLARMLDRAAGRWNAYLKNNGPPDPPDVAAQRSKVASLRAELDQGRK